MRLGSAAETCWTNELPTDVASGARFESESAVWNGERVSNLAQRHAAHARRDRRMQHRRAVEMSEEKLQFSPEPTRRPPR